MAGLPQASRPCWCGGALAKGSAFATPAVPARDCVNVLELGQRGCWIPCSAASAERFARWGSAFWKGPAVGRRRHAAGLVGCSVGKSWAVADSGGGFARSPGTRVWSVVSARMAPKRPARAALDPDHRCNAVVGARGTVRRSSHRRMKVRGVGHLHESASTRVPGPVRARWKTFVYHVSGGPRRAARAAGKCSSPLGSCVGEGHGLGSCTSAGQVHRGRLDRARFASRR